MSARRIIAIGTLAALASCQPAPSADTPPAVEYLVSDATREAGLPFSDAVRVGH